MDSDYRKIIPLKYYDVSYETDVREEIKDIVKKQIQKRTGVFIYGEVGTGKTHLACALAKYILESEINVRFYNTGDFLDQLKNEFDHGYIKDQEDYRGLFREIMDFKGILIFDDFGVEKMSDWVRERLYLIINKKYQDMYPMIFTSNCDLEIISARLGDRVSSRIIEMTELIKLTGRDKRVKAV